MHKGKIILKGKIELLTPLLIGSGNGDLADIEIIRDSEGKPFIPATSFIGVLKHSIKLPEKYNSDLNSFWGFSTQKKSFQSSLLCSDIICDNIPKISIRDGVAIDNKNGMAKKGEKYDFEIIEPGAVFCVRMTVNINDKTESFSKQMVATIIDILEYSKLKVGAKTTNGFGRLKLTEHEVYEYKTNDKKDVLAWLKNENGSKCALPAPIRIESKNFEVDAWFDMKTSMIVRSYSGDPSAPDAVHLRSDNKFVLPGTSVKGAIRARAEKILNTLSDEPSANEKIMHGLFGNVNKDDRSAIKSRLYTEETFIDGAEAEIQTRIKIDRFTGGTIKSALFDTMPLFADPKEDEKRINVRLVIEDFKDYEAGLVLLILKDLWTGDLAIGGEKNVGRGVLRGVSAEIGYNNMKITIPNDFGKLADTDKKELTAFVEALIKEVGNGK